MILPHIETLRLLLRSYTETDIADLVLLAGAREVAATTLRIAHPYTEQHARDFLVTAQEESKAWFAVALRSTGQLCGGVGLRIEPEHFRAELGYWIGLPYWRNGYASEAAQAALWYAFENLGLHRVMATCFRGNTASEKILLKIGMKPEGCMREHLRKWGEFIDVEVYGILRTEWECLPAAKPHIFTHGS
jgi:[ribosomal protein S5]-alanine N-acetyltransferase